MSKVYIVDDGRGTRIPERVACVDEDKELQRLPEQNLDLLPAIKSAKAKASVGC